MKRSRGSATKSSQQSSPGKRNKPSTKKNGTRKRRQIQSSSESEESPLNFSGTSDEESDGEIPIKRKPENNVVNLSEDDSSSSDESAIKEKPVFVEKAAPKEEAEPMTENEKPCELYDFSALIRSQQELKNVETKVNTLRKANEGREVTFLNKEENFENVLDILESCEKEGQGDLESQIEIKEKEPMAPVEIVIKEPVINKNCKFSQAVENFLKKEFNEERRSYQILMHKVHLLCLLAHGFYLNDILNDEEISALSLSLVTSNKFFPPESSTISYIQQLVKWFHKTFPVKKDDNVDSKLPLKEILIEEFAQKETKSLKNMVLCFISLTRVLGLRSRLLMSLQPVSKRPKTSDLIIDKNNKDKPEEKSDDDDEFIDVAEQSTSEQSPPKKGKGKKKAETRPSPKKGKGEKKADSTPKKKNQPKKKKIDRRVLSSDEETPKSIKPAKAKLGIDIWAEVFVEADGRWISVDVVRNDVDCITKIAAGCTKPISYVVGWDNNGSIKDLTMRYSSQWLTSTQKLRIDSDWWKRSISPWAPRKTKHEKSENAELARLIEQSPFPTAISDYKGHPYFALKRHLLKYEAIYPPDAVPIGYCKGEPIYSRAVVHELNGKEGWMRQGKVVCRNEEPYKVVKGRPKVDKLSGQLVKDPQLNLFGLWQVTDYMAPPAVDGKVPRNEYGNVELYKESMLPPGTVHLQLPGIMKVAKRLDIDCAPAVTGWDFHSGGSHPTINGVVVCKEFQQTLLDAWNREIDDSAERKRLKSRTRAIKNWKKLIRLVIVKKRLEIKYKFSISSSH